MSCRLPSLIVVSLAVALGVGCPSTDGGGASGKGGAGPGGPGRGAARGPVAVEVALVERGVLAGQERYVGELRAPEQVELASKLAGRLKAVTTRLGDRVRAGQVVAKIDDADLRAQLEEATSALAVARASVQRARVEDQNAEHELARKEPLAEKDLITRQELDNVRTRRAAAAAQLQLAQAQAQQAQARVKLLQQQVADSKITAPFAGSVDHRYLDPGAVVSPGAPVLRLVKTDPLLVRFMVPEREVGALRQRFANGGIHVDLFLDAYPDESHRARVVRMAPSVEASSRAAAVEAEIGNADGRLMAGMYGRVTLDLEVQRERPLVPLRALIGRGHAGGAGEGDPGGASVFVSESGVARVRPIRLGREDGERGEVLEGLTVDEKVVVAGQSALKDGAQVEEVGREGAP